VQHASRGGLVRGGGRGARSKDFAAEGRTMKYAPTNPDTVLATAIKSERKPLPSIVVQE
jgi:hypothetical protein